MSEESLDSEDMGPSQLPDSNEYRLNSKEDNTNGANSSQQLHQNDVDATESALTISKKQFKRLQKQEKWIAGKADRRKREKEKRKAKKAKLAESGEELISRKQLRCTLIKQSDSPCKVTVVIDCDYADYMNEQEMKKLCKQLNRCYAMNRHSKKPVNLTITSITGKVKELMEKNQHGYANWDAHCTEKHWTEMFTKDDDSSTLSPNIVYLSGDSTETIAECQEIQAANNGIFIIGGLIDHNRHKGLALERAEKYGVGHGQLPIGDHIRMTQRRILAIPHVFEIMLYAANGINGSWSEIFNKVIPNRKLATNTINKD